MIGQVNFTLRGRNPDVLTCIANLSNALTNHCIQLVEALSETRQEGKP